MTLNNIGAVYDGWAQYQVALDYFQQALDIRQEVGDQAGEARTLNNLGLVYHHLGKYSQALDYYQRALTIAEEIDDRAIEGVIRNNLGLTSNKLGEYRQALEYYQQALSIQQEIGDRAEEATTFNNFGLVYSNMGQYTRALEYFQQALAIQQEIGQPLKEEVTLSNIGMIYFQQYELEQAQKYFSDALAIDQHLGFQEGEGAALNYIGLIYSDRGEHQQALENYEQALAIRREIGDRAGEALTLSNMGFTYKNLGQNTQALEHYQSALAIQQEIGDRAGEANTLGQIGDLYAQVGDNSQAIRYYQQGVEVVESIQGKIKVEELTASYAAAQAETYDKLIALIWEEGRFEEAFDYAERARARAFLDQLAGGSLDFRAGASATLLEREQALRNEIVALHAQLINLRNRDQSEWDTGAISTVQADLANRESDYAQLLIEIKAQSPEVAGLVSVDVTSLADVQARLAPNTTLIEYFVTNDRTLAFIITRNTFETAAIEVQQDDLAQNITTFREFASLDDPHPASLKQLYTWLITPLKDKLKTPLVGIIPHGVLHYLPFAALTNGKHYLNEDYIMGFTQKSGESVKTS